MRRKPNAEASPANEQPPPESQSDEHPPGVRPKSPERSSSVFLCLFALFACSSWTVYDYQYNNLPPPLSADQAGKSGFSEVVARSHVKALTDFGPHSVGFPALALAIEYVFQASEEIKKEAHREVDVEVELFDAKSGAHRMFGGLFNGKTLAYSDLQHVLVRVSPKQVSDASENAILVSSHIDSVFTTGGAGDCSSCIAVMLELARGVSQWAQDFEHSVIFLFNIGEEEGLNGAHSFITQHPWSKTVRMAIDLEAMGLGGKSSIFQTGPNPWAIENYAMVAKYPSAQVIQQDLFSSGFINSATDFQVYIEVGGLSGLDFAYSDYTTVYHTKNDKLELLKSGSLQHLGENMLAFLVHAASNPKLPRASEMVEEKDSAIYFDILGIYMIVFRQKFAQVLYCSVIIPSLLIWAMLLNIGGYPAAVSFALSCLSVVLMWLFATFLSLSVALILPLVSSFPTPYIASPWLAFGLFAAPALIGALTGQHLGYLALHKYLSEVYSKREELSPVVRACSVKLEAERWLYKGGTIQWLFVLILGSYFKVGSTYIALAWLVPPTLAYGILEATLSPDQLPKPLKLETLVMGLAVPILISAGVLIRLPGALIGNSIRSDSNPGVTPEWQGNVIVAILIAVIVCLTLVYLLSYIHVSDMKRPIVLSASLVLALSLAVVSLGIVPPFTDEIARTVNVVQVVESTGGQNPRSYVSLFSNTPGKLTKEVEHIIEDEHINEGFKCGRDKVVDFVTFSVKYGCLANNDADNVWRESDIPLLHRVSETNEVENKRTTNVLIDTKKSTRWSLKINFNEIEDFTFKEFGNSEELVPVGDATSVDGWHIIQYSGGENAPTKFDLTLRWNKKSTETVKGGDRVLLKLRTDLDIPTPKVERVLSKLPSWCTPFGKATSTHTLAFLTSLLVNI